MWRERERACGVRENMWSGERESGGRERVMKPERGREREARRERLRERQRDRDRKAERDRDIEEKAHSLMSLFIEPHT